MMPEPETPPTVPTPVGENALDSVVQKTPWWAISFAFHTLAVLVLSFVAVLTARADFEKPVVVKKVPVRPDTPDFDRKPDRTPKDWEHVESDTTVPTLFKNPTDDDWVETPDEEDFRKAKGESEKFASDKPFRGPQCYDTIGVSGGAGGDHGGPFGGRKLRRPNGRFGPPKETEDAVLAALLWLARHQNPDGSWAVRDYTARCNRPGSDPCAPNPGCPDYDPGVTGLSLLAFLGAGYSHLSRDTHEGICFGTVVRKGLQHLMSLQDPDGCIGGRMIEKYMYNHTIGALALAEAYGLTGSNLFHDNAKKAIDFLVAAQNPGKGWRYTFKPGKNDTSVTGWAVMALKSAELSGLWFPRSSYEGARAWLDEATEENYYRVGYTKRGTGKVFIPAMNEHFNHHEALTAIGVMSRIFMDHNARDPRVRGGCDLLLRDLPNWEGNDIDFYYWYYASLALFQYGGVSKSHWQTWNGPMKEALVKNQNTRSDGCRNGSWEPVGRWCGEGGRVYATAINALTLEVYYRYANVFGGHRR